LVLFNKKKEDGTIVRRFELTTEELVIIADYLPNNDKTRGLLEKIQSELRWRRDEKFSTEVQWLDENYEWMSRLYGGEYAAIRDNELLKCSKSKDYLIGWLEGAGYNPDTVYVTYIFAGA